MKATIKAAIVKKLREEGNGITFANLSTIPGFEGEAEIEYNSKNIFIWGDCSLDAVTAIKELLNEQMIELHPTPVLTYLVSGHASRYAVARSDRAYSTPHWLPMVLKKGRAFDGKPA